MEIGSRHWKSIGYKKYVCSNTMNSTHCTPHNSSSHGYYTHSNNGDSTQNMPRNTWVVGIGICQGNKSEKGYVCVEFERIKNKYLEDIEDRKADWSLCVNQACN
eukprot:488087_1